MQSLVSSRFSFFSWVLSFLLCFFVVASNPLHAAASAGYSEFFIPGDEDDLRTIFNTMAQTFPPAANGNHTIIGVTAWTPETTVYYDHWEDGYDFDQNDPENTYDEKIILDSAVVCTQCVTQANRLFETTSISLPRPAVNPASDCRTVTLTPVCAYDGRDRIFAAGGAITVTRTGWVDQNPGTFMALAWEVYAVRPQLTTYILPFGEDLYQPDGGTPGFPAEQFLDFERVFMMVQATEDNTVLTIDFDADGTNDELFANNTTTSLGFSFVLNRGESFLVDRTTAGSLTGAPPFTQLLKGTIIRGTETLQVHYIIGDQTTDYEIRGLSAFPRGLWDDEYYAPVPGVATPPGGVVTAQAQDVTDIYLHNPHNKVLTVNYDFRSGGTVVSGSFTMIALETTSFRAELGNYVPPNTAVHFKADDVFWGVATIDASGSDISTVEGRIHDWGYSLVPAELLADENILGWAWGYDNSLASPDASEADDSGIFITPVQDNTTIFVDFNGTGTIDQTLNLSQLETAYISDDTSATLSGDLSGTRIFSTGPYVAAYGQNPVNATDGEPESLDLGYTIIPNVDFIDLVLKVDKSVDPVVLAASSIQTSTFTLVASSGDFTVDNVSVTDALPPGWSYLGPTSIILADKTTVTTAPAISGQDITWSSGVLGGMAANQEISISFVAQTDGSHTVGQLTNNEVEATGTRTVGSATQTFVTSDFAFNLFTNSSMAVTKVSNGVDPLNPGDTYGYTVTVTNNGPTNLTNVALFDPLPTGTQYVANSGMVTAPGVAVSYQDTFSTVTYSNNSDNTGGVTWASNWTEVGDNGGANDPSGGNIRIVGGNTRLRMRNGNRSIERAADLSSSSQALLSFRYRRTRDLEGAETSTVEVCQNFVAGTCVSGWVAVFVNGAGVDGSFITVPPIDLNGPTILNGAANSATFAIRVINSNDMDGQDEVRYDDFLIDLGVVSITSASHPAPSFVLADDNFTLTPGQSLTLTFNATVDDPLLSGITSLTNTVFATSAEISTPISAEATNQVVNPQTNTATVSGTVWFDIDSSGGIDLGEPGFSNIPVVLKDEFGATVATTTTNSLGQYAFNGVAPGNDYFVEIDASALPAGLTQVASTGSSDRSNTFNVSAGQDVQNINLGYDTASGTATLGDRVWVDVDGDGIQDLGEVGLSGVTVQLYIDDGATPGSFDPPGVGGDTLVTTTVTAADGSYIFPGVTSTGVQNYFVLVDVAQAAIAGPGFTSTNGNISTITDPADGDVILNLDFGFQSASATHTITDRVWFDFDGTASTSDTEDDDNPGNLNGESGIAGVTVDLLDTSANVIGTTVTDSNGLFSFTGVPGSGADYTVKITDTSGILSNYFGTSSEAQNRSLAINNLTADVDASAEPSEPHFGYNLSGTVGDLVFNDADDSGSLDTGELGISNVTVSIFAAASGGSPLATVATDSNGFYLFTGLPDGNYFVEINDAQSALSGFNRTTGGAGVRQTATVSGGSNELDVDYGYQAAISRSISGTIWENDNSDAVIDPGENRFSSVTVDLLQGGTVIATTTTDSNGDYSFANLPANTFTVRVTDTNGVLTGLQANFEEDGSPFDAENTVDLSAGDATDINFGFALLVVTNPVTLRSFHAVAGPGAGSVTVRWSTATEAGNLGFDLYVSRNGQLEKINPLPIPSRVINSVSGAEYQYLARNVQGNTLVLVDIDINGNEIERGPFEIGQVYGRPGTPARINWSAIRAEHQRKQQIRENQGRLAQSQQSITSFADQTTAVINLVVQEKGLYRVTPAQLLAAGVDLGTIGGNQLALLNRGQTVPIRVVVGGEFTKAIRYFEFWGESIDSLYTEDNIYPLVINQGLSRAVVIDSGSASLRTPVPAFYLETVQQAPQIAYDFTSLSDDPWFAAPLLAFGGAFQENFSLQLEDYLEDSAPVTLAIDSWGVTNWPSNNDHHMLVYLNGALVDDSHFDGLVRHQISQDVSAQAVQEGQNTIRIELPLDTGNDFDLINLESWQITYPRRFVARNDQLRFTASGLAFEVENFSEDNIVVYRKTGSQVEFVENVQIVPEGNRFRAFFRGTGRAAEYIVSTESALGAVSFTIPPADSGDILNGTADYLVIAHADFIGPTLQRLVQLRQASGLTVKVADIADVYAEFADHIVNAAAIQDYIRFAHRNMGTQTVLLVGGDTYDYLDYLGLGAVSFMPSLYTKTGEIVSFAPVDALYTDVTGNQVPDLAIGRLPVRNEADLATVIDKIIAYEQNSSQATALFVADEFDTFQNYSFRRDSEVMEADLPAFWDTDRIYLDDMSVAEARSAFQNAVNLGLPINGDHSDTSPGNRTGGVSLVNFAGHSGPKDWTFSGLLSSADVSALQNQSQPTLVTQWGCWNTYYVSPSEDTLGHAFMLNASGGAVAVLGASTLTDASAEAALAREVHQRIFTDGVSIGQAVLEAKQAYAASFPGQLDVILGWTILGDPAITLPNAR